MASLLVFAACAPENGLSGSVEDLFPLDVSSVEIRRNDQALQLTYLANRATSMDVVARVTLALEGITLQRGKKVNLAGEYAPGHARVTVVHAPGGEAVRTFPPVKLGDLVLTEGGQIGQLTRGTFSMSFQDEGGDLGAGRSLAGGFNSIALDGRFDPAP